jgi:ubiquinone/menaquinone biosynthesis C-methylase UbiE
MRLRDASASRIEATRGYDQARVDAYFETEAQTWDEIYEGADVYSVIHQLRLRTALRLVDDLGLPPDSHVLDLGCGAGICTLGLARRGFEVDGVDTVESMVDSARSKAAAAGLGDRIRVGLGDAHELDFEDESFDLVVALGVVSWLHDPSRGLAEVSRILKGGGHFVANVDNHARLPYFIDPLRLPILDRPRRAVKRFLERKGLIQSVPVARQYWPSQFDSLLNAAGLRKRKGLTYGFGVFTFLGRRALPEAVGLRLHARLQAAADRGVRGIRSTGAQYMVVAQKLRMS